MLPPGAGAKDGSICRGREHGQPYLIGLASYIEEDFRRWSAFDKAPRLASHSRDGVIELMPTSDGRLYRIKYVNGHPKNPRSGLQTVTAFGFLSDIETGFPRLLAEMTITTALRTAASSALAANKRRRMHGSSANQR